MKKSLFIIISIIYLILSIGFINYKTDCQNNMTTISSLMNTHDCTKCKNCGTVECKQDNSKECCKHNKELAKLSIDQQHSLVKIDLTPQQIAILHSILPLSLTDLGIISCIENYPVKHTPALEGQAPINILHCTYQI